MDTSHHGRRRNRNVDNDPPRVQADDKDTVAGMDINEALNLVGVYKGRYAAFEKIEEVLTAAATAANLATAKARELDALEADINTLERAKGELQDEITDLESKKTALVEDLGGLDLEISTARAELSREISDARSAAAVEAGRDLQVVKDALELYSRQADMRKRELRDEVATLENNRDAIKASLEQALQPVKP